MCVFKFFFLNDVKDNCLKSLSKLFQMLTALWRKCHWPDFVLLGGISWNSLFLVLWLWIDLHLWRDSQVYGGQYKPSATLASEMSFAFLTQTFSLQQEHYFQYKDKSSSIFGGTYFVTAPPFCSQVFLTKYSEYCLFCIFTKTKTGQCCLNI